MTQSALARFDRDTAVTRKSPGVYAVEINHGWWIVRGPNGGYIAALLANAVEDAVADRGRPLRSLTVHYLRPPTEGPATIETLVERSGRTVTTVSARLVQKGKLQALATAAHVVPRDTGGFDHATMPDVPPPERCDRSEINQTTPFHKRYERRVAIGPPPWSGAPVTREALSGGWIRLAEPRAWDSGLIAAVADAWTPAVFTSGEMPETSGVPTVDLTVHLIAPEAIQSLAPDEFVLVRFETQTVRGGYLEEDGEIWSPGGRLLARVRQIAVVL